MRFLTPADSASIDAHTLSLIGPTGPVPADLIVAEHGRLAFVRPQQDLLPGANYTLFVAGATSAGNALPFTTVSFLTRAVAADANGSNNGSIAAGSPVAPQGAGEVAAGEPSGTATLDRPAAAPVSVRMSTGKADAVAAFRAHCTDTVGARGFRFCRETGSVDGGIFRPGAANTHGRWRVNAPLPELPSVNDFPANTFPVASTSVFGAVRRIDDRPLAGVTVSIGALSTRTDATGRFVLSGVPAGRQVLHVDGSSANRSDEEYGRFDAALELKNGEPNGVPYNLYVPRITALDKISIPSPTTVETVLTHPAIPGFEVRLPAGAVLRDRNGRIVTELALVPLPTDRSPVPTPGNFQMYFSTQPDGVTIEGSSEAATAGLRVVYPNYAESKNGDAFWYYEAEQGGWKIYSRGQLSADGKSLAPISHYGVPRIMPAGSVGNGKGQLKGAHCPNGAGKPAANVSKPVDCSTGTFFHSTPDLNLEADGSKEIIRTYYANDPAVREFGVGYGFNYGAYLSVPNLQCTGVNSVSSAEIDLVVEGESTFKFISTTGTSPEFNTYRHTGTPTRFYGATLRYENSGGINNEGFLLQLKDGTQYWFPSYQCPTTLGRITDRFGNTQVSISYSAGLPTRLAFPGGRYVTLNYNSNNAVRSLSDNAGRTVSYSYDTSNRLTTTTYPDATTETYTYDPVSGNMATLTDRRGKLVVSNHYDANKRVDRQTFADGTTYGFAYTLSGSAVTATDATDQDGNVLHFGFDSAGYVIAKTEGYGTPLAQTSTYVRGQDELVTSKTDALNRVTTSAFDANGNLLRTTYLSGTPDAVTYGYTYTSDFNQIASVTDPLGHTTAYGYTAGCLTSVTDPLGNATTILCNSAGQPQTVTDALGHATTLSYLNYDLRSVTDALGRTTTFDTDSLGRVISTTDPLGRSTRTTYDSNGNVAQSVDALNQTTQYRYDGEGNLTSVTDPNGGITRYGYDDLGRRMSRTDAVSQTETWTYDGVGNVKTYTDRQGQVTQYQYDTLERPALVTFNDGSTIVPTYDTGDRLTTVVDSASGTITRSYDNLDRLTQEQTPQGTVSYTYDAAGRRASMTPGAQVQAAYTYDNANRLTKIVQGLQSVAFGYDNANRRTSLRLPNGIVTNYGYDNANELTSIGYVTSSGTTLGTLTYGYDAAGQRTSRVGGFAADRLPTSTTGMSQFDLANKQTVWNGFALNYDLNGDPTSNASTNPATTYAFDVRHRLTQIQQGASTIASFSYDTFGRRTSKTVNGVTTGFLYDGQNAVQEMQGGNVAKVMTGLGIDERFARDDAAYGRAYFLTDALGSTVGLADGVQVVRQTYGYEPYGEVTAAGTSDNSYQYTGRENDGTGLYYYRARYYSPALKRFISEDPTELLGGLNEYAFVGGDPIDYVDEDGAARQHRSNKRKSTEGKHQQGQRRKMMDRGGEKADLDGRRCPPRIRPKNWRGPWPPKPPARGFVRIPELGAGASDVLLLLFIPQEMGCSSLDGCGPENRPGDDLVDLTEFWLPILIPDDQLLRYLLVSDPQPPVMSDPCGCG